MNRLLIGLALLAILGFARADDGVITLASKYPVSETMDRLERVVTAARAQNSRLQVFARIDFRALSGEDIKPSELLIFGGGALVPRLTSSNPVVAIDLPIKVLVWEDDAGKVWVTYNSGSFLKDRHRIADAEAANRFTAVATSFVEKALR